jgi:hypothetical protein
MKHMESPEMRVLAATLAAATVQAEQTGRRIPRKVSLEERTWMLFMSFFARLKNAREEATKQPNGQPNRAR